jgi:hypothetical protein
MRDDQMRLVQRLRADMGPAKMRAFLQDFHGTTVPKWTDVERHALDVEILDDWRQAGAITLEEFYRREGARYGYSRETVKRVLRQALGKAA